MKPMKCIVCGSTPKLIKKFILVEERYFYECPECRLWKSPWKGWDIESAIQRWNYFNETASSEEIDNAKKLNSGTKKKGKP